MESVTKRQAKKSEEAMFWNRDIAFLLLDELTELLDEWTGMVRMPERLATGFRPAHATCASGCRPWPPG